MSALISFLGGSAFRAIWGELSSAWTRHQEHKHEAEMLRLQNEIDAARHTRMLEFQVKQAELGIKTIEAKGEIDLSAKEIDALISANDNATKATGHIWLDYFRQSVQPTLAYIAIFLWVSALNAQNFVVTDFDKEIIAAVFGMYLANRHLSARGK